MCAIVAAIAVKLSRPTNDCKGYKTIHVLEGYIYKL